MSNLVKRLRDLAACKHSDLSIAEEAANRIVQLEAALRAVTQEATEHHAEDVSRATLGGSGMAQRKAKAIVSRSGVLLHNIRFIARAALEERT